MTNVLIPGYPEDITIAKSQAKRLAKAIELQYRLSHSQALEVVAKMHGERSWGAMSAHFENVPAGAPNYDLGYRHVEPGEPAPDRNMRGWTPEELERLVGLLRTHPKVVVSDSYRAKMEKIVAAGCVTVGSIDDIFDTVSPKMGDFAFEMRGTRLVELFDIQTQGYLYRPDEQSSGTMGFEAVSVAGAASLLMRLERLGLDTHPEYLVDVVNRATAGHPMLTHHEVECLWYRSEKAGAGRQRLTAGSFFEDSDAAGEVFVTATGYICTVYRDERGRMDVLVVDRPVEHP